MDHEELLVSQEGFGNLKWNLTKKSLVKFIECHRQLKMDIKNKNMETLLTSSFSHDSHLALMQITQKGLTAVGAGVRQKRGDGDASGEIKSFL